LNIEINKEAVKSLKNIKGSGPVGIPTELIKHLTQKLYELLRNSLKNKDGCLLGCCAM
jgi:hypothetical protein